MSESRGDMIDKFQKEFEGIWPRDFVNYFKERVLPKANRLGKWALGEVNIYDESFFNHAGEENCILVFVTVADCSLKCTLNIHYKIEILNLMIGSNVAQQ